MKTENMSVKQFLYDDPWHVTEDDREVLEKYDTMYDLVEAFAEGKETSKNLFNTVMLRWADDDQMDVCINILEGMDTEGKYKDILEDIRLLETSDTRDDASFSRVSAWVEGHEEEGVDAVAKWGYDDYEGDELFPLVYQLADSYDFQDLFRWILENTFWDLKGVARTLIL